MNTPVLKHAAFSLLAFLVCLAGYFYWLSQVHQAQETVSVLEADIVAETTRHMQSGSARAAASEIEEREALIARHVVAPDDIVSFLGSLERLGSEFGANVTVLSVTDPDAKGRITLSLSISGSFDAVMRTVGVIEYGERVSAVRTLALDSDGGGTWNASLSVVILTPTP